MAKKQMSKESNIKVKKSSILDEKSKTMNKIVGEINSIFHELQVHQIELEIQNEELRQAQLELDKSRDKFFELYNFAPVGYLTLNEKGIIALSNLTASNLLGIDNSKLKNTLFTNFIVKEDQDVFYLNNKCLIETSKPQKFDLRLKRKDGKYFWAQLDTHLSKNENGDILTLITFGDISKRKEDEEEIDSNKKRIQSIFRVAPTGIGVVKDRILIEVNQKICDMTGYSEKELVGKSSLVFYPSQKEYDYVGQDKYKQINEKGAGTVETKWKKKDGTIINVLLSSTPIDLKDIEKGVLFTVLDITDKKTT